MKKKFYDLLHSYKVEAFKVAHSQETYAGVADDVLKQTEEALNNAYHYKINGEVDPRTVEILNMVKSFTIEAILPPVMEHVMRRVTSLEKNHELVVKLFDQILETLSDEQSADANAV